jgi:hypothetical protein
MSFLLLISSFFLDRFIFKKLSIPNFLQFSVSDIKSLSAKRLIDFLFFLIDCFFFLQIVNRHKHYLIMYFKFTPSASHFFFAIFFFVLLSCFVSFVNLVLNSSTFHSFPSLMIVG